MSSLRKTLRGFVFERATDRDEHRADDERDSDAGFDDDVALTYATED